jgi:CcmD family protein
MQQFLEQNSLFVVLAIVLVIWAGIIFYVMTVDKKIKKVEKEFKENKYQEVE